PELESVRQYSLELIGEEDWVRHVWGDRPMPAEYAARFPHSGPQLLDRLRAIDAEIAAEFKTGDDEATNVAETPALTVADFHAVLRKHELLDQGQLAELARARPTDVRAMARMVVERTWLTPYQVNQVVQGKAAGLVIGPYLVLERLGEGGAGQVFKARHRLLQRLAALKVIRKDLLTDQEVVARFRREIQLISQLSHPNVVRAYDAGQSGHIQFLAMEFVEGTDLGRMVKRGGPLPIVQACDYIRQAALGLHYASKQGLIHRDIKPHNLLVSAGDGLVKVTDLGLARLAQSAVSEELSVMVQSMGTLTPQNAVLMGTVDFMAPEQAMDFHTADIRADIYSLGCTLFYLLTGQPPFAGGNLAEKLSRHLQGKAPPLEQFRPDASSGLREAMQRMLAKRPEDRYQTPEQVAAALDAVIAAVPVSGRRGLARQGRRLLLAAAALLGLAGIAALALVLTPAPTATQLDLRWQLLELRMRQPGTPAALQAAVKLRTLPSPLDSWPVLQAPTRAGEPALVGRLIVSTPGEKVFNVICGPDGNSFVACTRKDGCIQWDLTTSEQLHSFGFRRGFRANCAPDGRALAVWNDFSQNNEIVYWNVKTQQEKTVLFTHPKFVAFSPDGKTIALLSDEKTRLVDRATDESRWEIANNLSDPRPMLRFAPDGQTLAVPNLERDIVIRDVATGKERSRVDGARLGVNIAFSYSPDGQLLAIWWSSIRSSLMVWDLAAGKPRTNLPTSSHVLTACFTPDGKYLFYSDAGNKLYSWECGTDTKNEWLLPPIYAIDTTPDGRYLLVGSDGTVLVYRLEAAAAP
ncbi:MAG: WD40 repeat domain-containing serine/threonine protein kinase, partial [Gemmataceae bacterium]